MAEGAAHLSAVSPVVASRSRARRKTVAQRRLEKICAALTARRRALVEAVAGEAREWIAGGGAKQSERVDLWFRIVNAVEAADGEQSAEATARLFLHVFRAAPMQAFTMWNYPWRALPDGVYRQLDGLAALGQRSAAWVRELEDWTFDPSISPPALAQLARHLLVKWEMPAFMDTVWLNDGWVWKEFHDWYVHVGAGGSPRMAGAPIAMSKQQIEFFAEVPAAWTMPEHVWRIRAYLDARGLGAAPEQARDLGLSNLGDSRLSGLIAERRAFWLSVLRFLIRHPEFPVRQVNQLTDFLAAQKFGQHAPAPGMSMKGRSPIGLLREMLIWQDAVARGATFRGAFKPSGRKGFETDAADGAGVWTIVELLSSREVLEEGLAMRHCVANYIGHCAMGRTSIWSLKRVSRTGRATRRLTLEVDFTGQIAQARGLGNRWPTAEEKDVLRRWAEAETLTIAKTLDARRA